MDKETWDVYKMTIAFTFGVIVGAIIEFCVPK